MAHIRVMELNDGEGLSWTDGEIVAWSAGVPVARAASAQPDADDDGLLALFPGHSFSHGAPASSDYLIDMDLRTASGRRVEGMITAPDGTRYPWIAERVAAALFRERPEADGAPGPAARGWAYRIPGQLTGDDPVLGRRLGVAVLTVLDDLASGRDPRLPVRRRISNVFSADDPAPSPSEAPALDELVPASRR